MKIYIADDTKLENYVLPTKIEDSYLIHYISTDGIIENIILTAKDGQWMVNETQNFHIKKGIAAITSDIVANLNFYDLKFGDIEEKVKMYCFDLPLLYKSFSILDKSKITLGKVGTDIEYNSAEIGNLHFTIEKKNEDWHLHVEGNGSLYAYVNGKKIIDCSLKRGDILFANGLKIIWLETFLLINNLGNLVKINLPEYKKLNDLGQGNLFTPVQGMEKYATLYKDNQVFFHTPRLKSSFNAVTIHIDAPPEAIRDDGPPAILTLGTTVMMGISSSITGLIAIFSVITGKATLLSAITEMAICISLILGCVFFPILLDKYQRRKIKAKEKKRQEKYSDYLNKKKKLIEEEMRKEKSILFQNHLNSKELLENLKNNYNKIWNREINDNDFLTFRLGIGDRKASITVEALIEDFRLEDDNLKEEVENLINTNFILDDVPISISGIQNRILPIIIDDHYEKRQEIIDNIMLQLITYYSGMDLKIVILTDKHNASNWEYIKYLPHCRSNDNEVRFFATTEDEMKQLSVYLENVYNERVNKSKVYEKEEEDLTSKEKYRSFDEYYLLITDNYILAKNSGIVDKILNSNLNIGFSLMMIEQTLKNIPSKCNHFIQYETNKAGIFSKDLSDEEQFLFSPDYFEENIRDYAEIIANIPASVTDLASQLPTSLSFLEMYNVGKVEQLNVLSRWENNDPTLSLKAPIGVHPDGKVFDLDLHEKYYGPHGLIAGSTGSGKSEFIITFILSMAINYHPNEVQFVLIDYKGGGLAGAFENRETGIKIPHLVGTITNLDTAEMNRTLVSIQSELKRRQRIFNEARDSLGESTIDIYKYQKYYREGKVKEPVSHLFIISDEFAELKAQQPDFMDELVSTARIGRSLGVHLILATQKPSGVVDDQIWSNSRFKVCLKVQSPEDSIELLKRSEAASIKETGRFYLQIGYDELFEIGQSAWSGAKYIPQDRMEKVMDDSIRIVDNNGNLIKQINDQVKLGNQIDYGEELTNIVKNLYEIAKRENIFPHQLWLPSISKEIYLMDIVKKYNYSAQPYFINPLIGEYDLPAHQQQKMLTVDFTNTGNLIIYGNPGTGKENLIITILYSICIYHTTDEINIYIMDFGAETLKIFNAVPQVGDVVLVDDRNKVRSLFLMLEREINKRRELFSNYGGSYASYIKTNQDKIPMIMVVLNGYESFVENYGDYDDFFGHLIRESAKYGIVFIMSVIVPGGVKSKLSQSFNNKIALQLSDSFDYKYYLDAPNGLIPSKHFGRGIVAVEDSAYEMQSCFIYYKDQTNYAIQYSFDKVKNTYKKAKPIPVIPRNITSDILSAYIDSIENVPIGINVYDASIVRYNFLANQITQIIGNNILIENDFINDFVSMLSSVPNVRLKVVDFVECIADSYGLNYINNNFTENLTQLFNEERNKERNVYILLGLGYIYDKVLDEGIEILFSIFKNLQRYTNNYFIFVDNYSSYKRIMKEEWYHQVVQNENGIWVGKGIELQKAIRVPTLTMSDMNEDFRGLAYVVNGSNYQVIKSLGTQEGSDLN